MRLDVGIPAALVMVASLALVGPPVEGRGIFNFMNKLSKEWKTVDNFLREGSSSERINKYYAERQSMMEPKLRHAFQLVVDAASVHPPETECSEAESLKVARLLRALNINMDAEFERKATGVRRFAFEVRKNYGDFCAKMYVDQVEKTINDNVEAKVKTMVERFGAQYAYERELTREDLFSPVAEVRITSMVTGSLMGRALYEGLKGAMSQHTKELNTKTGKEEYNWLELVEDMRGGCKIYQGQAKELLRSVSKDAVASRALLRLASYSRELWRSWAAVIACDSLQMFELEELAKKVAFVADTYTCAK